MVRVLYHRGHRKLNQNELKAFKLNDLKAFFIASTVKMHQEIAK